MSSYTFEYMTDFCPSTTSPVEKLNSAGAAGWELVHASVIGGGSLELFLQRFTGTKQKFEYTVRFCGHDRPRDGLLNQNGTDGWMLSAVLPKVNTLGESTGCEFIMRRRVFQQKAAA